MNSRTAMCALASCLMVVAGAGVSQRVNAAGAAATSPARTAAAQGPAKPEAPLRAPDVIFVPTPPRVVEAMLDVAKVGTGDVLYDLGSGDGRIVIAAAKDYGIRRGIGIDIDPERVAEARQNAKRAGVEDRVRFLNADLFEADFSDATVVTLYLLPDLNLKLRPKLLATLRPGTRVVSHAFDMGDWEPDSAFTVDEKTVYFWTIPARSAKR